MKKLFPLIAILSIATIFATSCSTINSLISKVDTQSTNSAPYLSTSKMVEDILARLHVDIVPHNVTAGISYNLQLYERGQLRTSQDITFTADQLAYGQVITVYFPLTYADFNGINTVDYPKIFSVKISADDVVGISDLYFSRDNKNGGYCVNVIVKPTYLAKPNTDYKVNLYHYDTCWGTSSSISWSASELNSASARAVTFLCTEGEYLQYYNYNLANNSNIFSVKVTQ